MDDARAAFEAAVLDRKAAKTELTEAQAERDAAVSKAAALEKRIEAIANQGGKVWHIPVEPGVPRFVPAAERRTRVISVLNLKGGVGKTTITANLAGYLATTLGRRVLVVDLDHQRSLTQLLLSTADRKAAAIARRTVQDFLLSAGRGAEDLCNAAQRVAGLNNCAVVTNSDAGPGFGTQQNLDDLEMWLLGRWLTDPSGPDIRFLLRKAVHSAVLWGQYDYVLFDCPPRLTTACINALTASDFVLIPAQAEQVSIRSVPHLLWRLRGLREAGVLSHLRVLGVVANMVSDKAAEPHSLEAKVLQRVEGVTEEKWGRPVRVFRAKLRRSEHYPSTARSLEETGRLSLAVGKPLIHEQYEQLFQEIQECLDESLVAAGVPA